VIRFYNLNGQTHTFTWLSRAQKKKGLTVQLCSLFI